MLHERFLNVFLSCATCRLIPSMHFKNNPNIFHMICFILCEIDGHNKCQISIKINFDK
jgi:hypothetical protein